MSSSSPPTRTAGTQRVSLPSRSPPRRSSFAGDEPAHNDVPEKRTYIFIIIMTPRTGKWYVRTHAHALSHGRCTHARTCDRAHRPKSYVRVCGGGGGVKVVRGPRARREIVHAPPPPYAFKVAAANTAPSRSALGTTAVDVYCPLCAHSPTVRGPSVLSSIRLNR